MSFGCVKFARLLAAAALLWVAAGGQTARAFGGFVASGSSPLRPRAVAALLADNADGTVTAVVQLAYEGPPQEFGWVVAVPSVPVVGLSSSEFLRRLDGATSPQYWREVGTRTGCVEAPDGGYGPSNAESSGSFFQSDALERAPVSVLSANVLGDYEQVTVAVADNAADPAQAALDWLSAHGFGGRGLDRTALQKYLHDGYKLVAFKLRTTDARGALRPIRLTYTADRLTLPSALSGSAGLDREVLLWVVGEAQAVPDNQPSLVLNAALIDWLSGSTFAHGTLPAGGNGPVGPFGRRPSNYDGLLAAAVDQASGGFVTELAGPASQYRELLWSSLDEDLRTAALQGDHEDGLDAVAATRFDYAGWDGWYEAVAGAASLPSGVSVEALSADPEAYRGQVQVDLDEFLRLLETRVIDPVERSAALLRRGPYLTRLASRQLRLHAEDPSFAFNGDLAQIDHIHVARQSFGCEPEQGAPAWVMRPAQGGAIAGSGEAWPFELDSMPASLKVVALSARGSGQVVHDNRPAIRSALLAAAGSRAQRPTAQVPAHGLKIGGSHELFSYKPPTRAKRVRQGCSVAVGPKRAPGLGLSCLCLAGLWLGVRRRGRRLSLWGLVVAAGLLIGCEQDSGVPQTAAMLGEQLLRLRDPETCKECHPGHYQEWSSSMHAYAAKDPVFIAMNQRGQRETGGALGDFCVRCHAPMAVVDGLTQDGLNIEELPDFERGVSCYYCHNAAAIEDDHNAKLRLANDATMRGPIEDAMPSGAHDVAYSNLFDEDHGNSSAMCGACHDIVTPTGVRLERTYQEYLSGVFSKNATDLPEPFETCLGCHMDGRTGRAANVPGAPERIVHEHFWPAVDLALIDFPNRDAMRSAVEDCQLRKGVAFFTLEVTPPDLFTFQIETGAGHNQPSGAAQDRRLWLELLAYDEAGELIEELSTGNIADDEMEEWPPDHPRHDPRLVMFRDRIYDAQGHPVHMFWEAEKSERYPDGYVSETLPPATTTYVEGKHAVVKQFRLESNGQPPARVTARLRLRPIGFDVLQDLVDSGDLDAEIMAQMPTLTLPQQIEWTPQQGFNRTLHAQPTGADCTTYVCLLHPDRPECAQ